MNNQCIAKPDLITFQRHCMVMQSVLESSLHVYLVFPQHPYVCSPQAQQSSLCDVHSSSPLPTSAYLQQKEIKLQIIFLLLSTLYFQVQFENNITIHLTLCLYTMILL